MRNLPESERTAENSEDLVQDVLLAVHQKRHTYDPQLPILPWLQAVARYRMIDRHRASNCRPRLVQWAKEFDGTFANAEPHYADQQVYLETQSERTEFLMRGLSIKQRNALVLAKVEELPLEEVAQRLEMSLAAVKVSVHRAVQTLRKSVKRSLDSPGK